jgi:hypothetical protein
MFRYVQIRNHVKSIKNQQSSIGIFLLLFWQTNDELLDVIRALINLFGA